MASGKGSIPTSTYPSYTWEYSYSTSEDTSNVYVSVNIYFNPAGSWSTSLTPGFIPCAIPNVSPSSIPSDKLSDTTGDSIISWIESKGGDGEFHQIADGDHGTGKYFNSNLTVTLPKGTSKKTVSLYIGSIIQSTYLWDLWGAETTISIEVPSKYTAPSGLSFSSITSDASSISVKCTWTDGVNSTNTKVTVTINGTSKPTTSKTETLKFTGLSGNKNYSISGVLSDDTTSSASTASSSKWTTIATPTLSLSSTTTSITATAGANGNANPSYQYKLGSNGTWGSSNIFTVQPNTYYTVYAKIVNTSNTEDSESDEVSKSIWTYPVINDPIVSLKSGSEHNTINVSVSASVSAGSYDQFTYAIDNNSWLSYDIDKTHAFTGLSGNTSYKIWVKMKNTSSGFESASKSVNITTWHNPLTNLKINLTDSWFWYLAVNCSYTYTGSITKYEFAIGDDQDWINTGTTNAHSRGSTSSTGTGKLNYNTNYNCWVRLTDNHGRTYGYQNTTYTFTNAKLPFKTLDERPLYVDGELKEVKIIKSDGSVIYITPNLLTIVKSDGTTVNMNKIINNDDRIEY